MDSQDGDETSIPGEINTVALVDRIAVTPTGEGTFRGEPIRGFAQRPFGGHLLAQASMAAAATAPHDRVLTSAHVSFLRPGTNDLPFDYSVEMVRDGGSFTSRAVSITQEGRVLATVTVLLAVSSHLDAPVASTAAPTVPDPEDLAPLHRRRETGMPFDAIRLPTRATWRTASRPLDIRYIDDESDTRRCLWFRGDAADGATRNQQRALVAFASDRSLIPVIVFARARRDPGRTYAVTSIEHSIWFHEDVLAGQWHLYEQHVPTTSARTGLAAGSIFARTGELVATVTQLGLVSTTLD